MSRQLTHRCRDGVEAPIERGLSEYDDVVVYRCTRPCGLFVGVVAGEASLLAGTTMGEAQ